MVWTPAHKKEYYTYRIKIREYAMKYGVSHTMKTFSLSREFVEYWKFKVFVFLLIFTSY